MNQSSIMGNCRHGESVRAFADLDKGTPTHHTKYHTLSKKNCQTLLTGDFIFGFWFFLKTYIITFYSFIFYYYIEEAEVFSIYNGDSFRDNGGSFI